MRVILASVFVALIAPTARAADTDADKAKAVTTAFLAAIKAKDLDALMKTTDVPFVFNFGHEDAQTFEKADGLKVGGSSRSWKSPIPTRPRRGSER